MCYNVNGGINMKRFSLLLLVVLLLCSCGKKEELSKETTDAQLKLIDNITSSSPDKTVIEFLNEDNEKSYYIYYISGVSYKSYLEIIHNNKKSYEEYITDFQSKLFYNLEYDKKTLSTKIFIGEGIIDSKESFIKKIEKKYSSKTYKIYN